MNMEINIEDQPQMYEEETVLSFGDDWIESKIRQINAAADAHTHGGPNESLKISKPPKALLDVRPLSYRPQLMTIGPLHDMLSDSASADRCKELCVWRFMQRHGIPDVKQLMQRIFEDPRSFLDTHYSNPLDYNSLEILQLMLTLDTILIYEFFLYMCATVSESTIEQYGHFQTLWKNDIIGKQFFRDLFLMGNQIPMSFLKRIAAFPNENEVNLKDLQAVLVDIVVRSCPFPMGYNDWHKNVGNPNLLNCEHLLDCQYVLVTQGLHEHKRSPQIQHNGSRNLIGAGRLQSRHRDRLPPASQLSKVGISFHAHKSGTSLIKYHRRTLQLHLPRIVVYEGTENVLRNLLAYEQTSKEGCEFAKYVVIMDSLIYTTEDLAILMKAGVIVNHLGSDQKLANMWNNMCENVTIRSCGRWDKMTCEVLHDYENPWRRMYVEFHEKFFSRPWLTTSVIDAILILILTLLQTVYTILGYY